MMEILIPLIIVCLIIVSGCTQINCNVNENISITPVKVSKSNSIPPYSYSVEFTIKNLDSKPQENMNLTFTKDPKKGDGSTDTKFTILSHLDPFEEQSMIVKFESPLLGLKIKDFHGIVYDANNCSRTYRI
jgi:hypothetical protein